MMDALFSLPTMQALGWQKTLFPVLISAGGGICLLLLGTFKRSFSRNLHVCLALVFLAINLFAVWDGWTFQMCASFATPLINLEDDELAFRSQMLIALPSLLIMVLVFSKERFVEFQTPEFYPLYLFMVAGFELMVAAKHLLLVLIGLESASLCMCVLMALNHKKTGIEAGLKYFSMGVLASVFFVMGAMLVYLSSGEFRIDPVDVRNAYLFMLYLVFIVGAVGFKVSLVPFHTWMPDVYEGNNPVFAAFISIVPKIAGLAVIFRILYNATTLLAYQKSLLGHYTGLILTPYLILIALTITVPNVLALLQKDAKRMMAYSSISHAGFALLCIGAGMQNMLMYWFLFLCANIGAFAFFWLLTNKQDALASEYAYPYARFNGLIRTHPVLALLGAIFFCSLAGIPPFSMFWGKLLVLQGLITAHGSIGQSVLMPLVVVINSAISVVYYFRLLVAMFFKPAEQNQIAINSSYAIYALVFAMALLCLFSVWSLSFYFNTNHPCNNIAMWWYLWPWFHRMQ